MADSTSDSKTDGKSQSKAAFVRALPKDMPALEVVAKAKAVGMILNPGQVHNIRSVAKAAKKKKRAAKATAPTEPKAAPVATKNAASTKAGPVAKKTATASATSTAAQGTAFGSKRAFVDSLPPSTPAADVVEAAKKQGLDLTKQYVYVLRSKAGSKRPARGKVGRPKGSKNKVAPAVAAPAASVPAATAPVKRGPGRPKSTAAPPPAAAKAAPTARGSNDLENAVAGLVIEYGRKAVEDVLGRVGAVVAQLPGRA